MNSRFKKFMRLRHDAAGEQLIEQAKIELFKSFAMLSDEEQEFAQIIIRDIQLGVLMPDEDKTFRDYISEYMCKQKDGQIHRFAECFGLDEIKLKELLSLNLNTALNELGRFDDLKNTADFNKVKEYFKKQYGEISPFKIGCVI